MQWGSYSRRFLAFSLLITLVVRGQAPAPYTFTTLAGVSPTQSQGAVDGDGANARFNNPSSVAADSAGNVFVADTNNHTIRKITPDGTVSTYAGIPGVAGAVDGSVTTAKFNKPTGVAVDGAGNVYVSQLFGGSIRMITPGGAVSSLPVSITTVYNQIPSTYFAVNSSGDICIFDGYPGGDYAVSLYKKVSLYNYTKTTYKIGISYQVGSFTLTTVYGMYVDADYIYLAGGLGDGLSALAGVYRIKISDGKVSQLAAGYNPCGIVIDNSGSAYICYNGAGNIARIDASGSASILAGGAERSSLDGQGISAGFYFPNALTIDGLGNLYVCEPRNNVVRKITPGGSVKTLAGISTASSEDGLGVSARFENCRGLSIDKLGNLFQSDCVYSSTFRKITQRGNVTTLAGSRRGYSDGVGVNARFDFPAHTAVDPAGNTYVVDGNSAIRKVSPTGLVTTIAGQSGVYGSLDGNRSVATFTGLYGIAVNAAGTIYVSDNTLHTIRRIGIDGMVTTLAGSSGVSGSQDGVGTSATFNKPAGLAMDNSGNLYVVDAGNSRLRKVAPDGTVSTITASIGQSGVNGSGGAVAIDTSGYLYTTYNNLINRISPDGLVELLGGSSRGWADGTGSAAKFSSPDGIAVDAAGNVFVSDSGNNTVRVAWVSAPQFVNAAPLRGVANSDYIGFTPVTLGQSSTFSASGLPPGLVLDSSTGSITGVPSQVGSYNVNLSATNSLGTTSTQFTFTVAPYEVGDDIPALPAWGSIFLGFLLTLLAGYFLLTVRRV